VKKLLFGAAGLVVILVASALIVPSFINWNEYKGEITAEVEKRTGRTLVIDGDIGLTLLPAPAVVATDLRLGNMAGGHAEDMVRLRSLAVNVALGPLLRGRVQVQKVRLVDPVVNLEVLADGRNNWTFAEPPKSNIDKTVTSGKTAPSRSDRGFDGGGQSDAGAGPPLSVQLDSLEIENAVVSYRDDTAGWVERIEDLTATVAADSLRGPFEAEGELSARGLHTGFKVALGRIGERNASLPVSVVLTSEAGKTRLELRGTASDLSASPAFSGSLKLETGNLAELMAAVSGGPPGGLSLSMDLAGEITASETQVDVNDVSLHLGKTGATGKISARLEGKPAISAQLAIAHLDVDSWLEAALDPGTAAGSGTADTPSEDADRSRSPESVPDDEVMRLPAGLNVLLALSAEAITYRAGVIRDARVNAELAGGEITISQISGDLPGATEVAAFGFVTLPGGAPRFDGEIDIKAGDVRGLLGWLGVDTGNIPPGRVRTIDLKSKFAATPGAVRLEDMNLEFDASRVTGRIAAAIAERPAVDADLVIDRIDVDPYLPAPGAALEANGNRPVAGDQPTKSASGGGENRGLEALTAFDARLKARVGRLTYRGTPFETVVVDAALRDGVVDVSTASVGNVAGASGRLAGVIEPLARKPGTKKLGFEFDVPNLDRLLRAFGLPRPDPVSTVGPFALSGTTDGPFLAPTVNFTLHAAGGETKLSGKLDAFPNPAFSGRIKLVHVNLVPLLGSLGINYRPAGRIGALDLAGRLDADSTQIQLSEINGAIGDTNLQGSVHATMAGGRPHVAADLKTGHLVIAPYLPADRRAEVAPRLIPASWGGARAPRHRGKLEIHMAADAPHRRWSRAPVDLSVLQTLDGDLKLKSDALIYDRVVLDDVSAVAKLAGGVLTAEPLGGLLFRGPFQAKLRLDANGTPQVNGTLMVKNASLARATRDAKGRAVATGQMAFDAKVASRGISTADLVARLDGSGSVRMSNVEVGKGAAGGSTASLINLLQQLNGIGAGLGVSGSRAEVTATYRITNGMIRSDDIALNSGLGDGGAQGVIDLPRWHMDVGGKIRLTGNILTGLMIETKGSPIIPFRIRGPVDDPSVNVDANALKIRRLVIPDPKDLDVKKGLKELRKLFGK